MHAHDPQNYIIIIITPIITMYNPFSTRHLGRVSSSPNPPTGDREMIWVMALNHKLTIDDNRFGRSNRHLKKIASVKAREKEQITLASRLGLL
jgi:hypothetical protein